MSVFIHRPLPVRPYLSTRAFSTSLLRSSSLHIEKNDPELVADTIPAYPYGPARWYKQSNTGLYGTRRVQFGNNVGPKFKTKTRRTWHPNIVRKRLWSHALGRSVQVKVQTRVLRTIDKVGGLDEYLLGDTVGRIKELGVTGWWLRWAIMQTPYIKKRFAAERERLGLTAEGVDALLEEPPTTLEGEVQIATKGQNNPVAVTSRRSASFRQARLLKFRVARGKHFVFTSEGWRRAQPDIRLRKRRAVVLRDPVLQNYSANAIKQLGPRSSQAGTVDTNGTPVQLENTESIMDRILKRQKVTLTEAEEKQVRKAVARAMREEQNKIIDKKIDKEEARIKERRRLRNQRRGRRQAAGAASGAS